MSEATKNKEFVRELDNILSVELTNNGNDTPVAIWSNMGRRYRVVTGVFDVTDDPFYRKEGFAQRLAAESLKAKP